MDSQSSAPKPAAEPAPAVPAVEIRVQIGADVVFAIDLSGNFIAPTDPNHRSVVGGYLAFALERLASLPPAVPDILDQAVATAETLAAIDTPEAAEAFILLRDGARTVRDGLRAADAILKAHKAASH